MSDFLRNLVPIRSAVAASGLHCRYRLASCTRLSSEVRVLKDSRTLRTVATV